MKSRWPHSAPFLNPPATAKLPLAPDGVPVIHPPPVAKSGQEGGGGGSGCGQPMSACADDTTTSATPLTTTWSALTVISPGAVVCSLMTTCPCPFGSKMVWLGCPLTTIDALLIVSSAISELPLVVAPPSVHRASARAMRKPAELEFPPAARDSCATGASERLCLPSATEHTSTTTT